LISHNNAIRCNNFYFLFTSMSYHIKKTVSINIGSLRSIFEELFSVTHKINLTGGHRAR